MKTTSSLALVVPVVLLAGIPAFGQAPPADDLLKSARLMTTLQQQDLTGQIRKESTKIPVGLFLKGENIQFTYRQPRNGKAMRFHMRHGNGRFELFDIVNGKTRRFPDARVGEAIEGTDLSYEDLAMGFLHWPKGEVEGAEKIGGEDCWRLRVVNPGRGGRYAQVRVWIHKKQRALMQVVGFNPHGQPLKRFAVTKVMRVGNTHTLKQMRVERFNPATGKELGLTYLEFDAPEKAAPGPLR